MKKLKVYTVDAFSNVFFQGNPAGVVIDADELTDDIMQEIAKEINLSETAFVIKSNKENVNYKVRYFTPTVEIDFCGHATLALAWVLKKENFIQNNHLIIETNVGIIPLSYQFENNNLSKVFMKQISPKVKEYNSEIQEICDLVGINKDDLDDKLPIKLAYTGNWHLLIPIKNKKIIDEANPNYTLLGIHNKNLNVSTTHLYTINTNNEDYLVYTRDFAPACGVNEDPVTGSANGALAGFLYLEKIFKNKNYKIVQGNSKNRLGELFIHIEEEENNLKIVIGGNACIIINGFVEINSKFLKEK